MALGRGEKGGAKGCHAYNEAFPTLLRPHSSSSIFGIRFLAFCSASRDGGNAIPFDIAWHPENLYVGFRFFDRHKWACLPPYLRYWYRVHSQPADYMS